MYWRPNATVPYGALDTDERLPTEETPALADAAVAHIEAVFQREDSAVAAAEILDSAQAPARRKLACNAGHAEQPVASRICVRDVLDAGIDNAVQGDARLR